MTEKKGEVREKKEDKEEEENDDERGKRGGGKRGGAREKGEEITCQILRKPEDMFKNTPHLSDHLYPYEGKKGICKVCPDIFHQRMLS